MLAQGVICFLIEQKFDGRNISRLTRSSAWVMSVLRESFTRLLHSMVCASPITPNSSAVALGNKDENRSASNSRA